MHEHPEHREEGQGIRSSKRGGVIGINIDWECDLDWSVKYCNPSYAFRRLDDANAPIAKGFNFRLREQVERFVSLYQGTARKFHILPLTMNIGSGLALLGLAPTICDIIILNLLRYKDIYHRAKFEVITEEREKLAARKENRAKPYSVSAAEEEVDVTVKGKKKKGKEISEVTPELTSSQ
ncbi:uncharacterized protein DEA37_0000790 [Paragonimus westermani]|uniref:Uncharacterized protein n=1 Tax=Paragonimus westermani TaxID=34504 RepID=A0A5J4NUW9_9TREM|nr:uncharacterized protein DEA37_0000790 [Paragonimus westermani]